MFLFEKFIYIVILNIYIFIIFKVIKFLFEEWIFVLSYKKIYKNIKFDWFVLYEFYLIFVVLVVD